MLEEKNLITNDGIRIAYYDTEESKQPILAVPGIGSTAILWEEVAKLFASDYRFIVIDPRNQGRSQRTFKGQRISRHAADLEELITKLNLKNIIAIGNSMGAANIWAYVSLFGYNRLQAIIDLDQPPKMIRDSSWEYGFKDLTWQNYPDYLKINFGNGNFTHINDEMFKKAKADSGKFRYFAEENFLCRIEHAMQDWRDVLIDLKIPMLVLAGQNSPFFDYHFAFAMEKLNQMISAKIIKNCGHLIQAEQPLSMYKEVMSFLKRI
ncbi:alpha/beta fold hydrolase [Lactobacillus kimbladii]|uniref:alpha/beta fold hydrolase n=1 Tax=Lactobacillus kimbladii TaxID=1218506 RepID=UPI003AF57337